MAYSLQDHFANVNTEDHEGYNFEDTYDGLGDDLEESLDEFNNETFGASMISGGKDFDFYGKTQEVADAIDEEQISYSRRKPQKAPAQILKEETAAQRIHQQHYQQEGDDFPRHIQSQHSPSPPEPHHSLPSFVPNASLWGNIQGYNPPNETPAKKYLSLEEVEAQVLRQVQSTPPSSAPQSIDILRSDSNPQYRHVQQNSLSQQQIPSFQKPVAQIDSHPSHRQDHNASKITLPSQQIVHQRTGSIPFQPPTPPNFQQIMNEESHRLIAEDAKRRRRAAKITSMARYNGTMSPNDKNFIQRIGISALVTENPYVEDFYYQVHTSLARTERTRGQGLSSHAQTYLKNPKGGRRMMESQVMRAVQHAKNRPKSGEGGLMLEGALGKIAFHSSRTPRMLLNIRKPVHVDEMPKGEDGNRSNERRILKSIEATYDLLLEWEECYRTRPQEGSGDPQNETLNDWKEYNQVLVEKIWTEIGMHQPIDQGYGIHPFVRFLSYRKSKKAIPRIWRTLDYQRQLTLITMTVANLSQLDVIRLGHCPVPNIPPPFQEDIDIFITSFFQTILPFIESSPLSLILGLSGILLQRWGQDHIYELVETKTGLAFLTMMLSRAEIIKQQGDVDPEELEQWKGLWNVIFQGVEGRFLAAFASVGNWQGGDDVYVWQFLASIAVGAEEQQHLILLGEVREKVLENVVGSKKLPRELAAQKFANVNMFLKVIGLDANDVLAEFEATDG